MANNITVLGQLKPGGFEGVVDAEDVAYSYKTEGGIKQIDKSLKDKIDEIFLEIQKETNIDLTDQLDKIQRAVQSSLAAQKASEDARDLAQQYKNSIQETSEDLEHIKELANTFSTAFDADANFVICSEEEYNNAGNGDNPPLVDNCIYFCYKA